MNFLLKGLIKMFSCRFLPRQSLLSVISFCNWKENLIPVGVQDKNLVITSTKLVWFLLYLEYWCIMILQLGKLSRTRSILLIFWRILVVFWTCNGISLTVGWRLQSKYTEMFQVWEFIELITDPPGIKSLFIFDFRLKCGVLEFSVQISWEIFLLSRYYFWILI